MYNMNKQIKEGSAPIFSETIVSQASSCPQKIQQDIINSSSNQIQKQNKFIRSAQECEKIDTAWQQLSEKGKQQYQNQIKNGFALKKPNWTRRKDGAFVSEIIQSEEVSINESFNSQEELLQFKGNKDSRILQLANKKQPTQKQIAFNMLVVGATGIGKSTFIECFLNKNYERQPIIRQRTKQLTQHCWVRQVDDFHLNVKLIDIPGYYDQHICQYIHTLQTILLERMKKHQEQPNKLDQRIHCCLFFLKGPRTAEEDWKVIKAIQKYANIIPLISKGDTYTLNEIKEFKKNVLAQQIKHSVSWFDGEEYIRQNYPQELKNLKNGRFGAAPPFVVVGCTEPVGDDEGSIQYGRLYPWGQCQLQNQRHTDYLLFKKFIITYFSLQLIQYTDAFQKNLIQPKRNKFKQSSYTTAAIGLVVGLMAYKLYQYSK